jgi:hypothetical protein
MCNTDIADQARWIKRKYSTSHPIIRWLPSKLVAWIGNDYGQELGIPPMRGHKWTAGELNTILLHHMVPSTGGACQLGTFGCIEWESELYSCWPKARCYPFYLPSHRFQGKTCQVWWYMISYMISYMTSYLISYMISYVCAGGCHPVGVFPQQSESCCWILSCTWLWFDWKWTGVVCTATALFQRHPLYLLMPGSRILSKPQGGVPGVF